MNLLLQAAICPGICNQKSPCNNARILLKDIALDQVKGLNPDQYDYCEDTNIPWTAIICYGCCSKKTTCGCPVWVPTALLTRCA